VTEDVTWDTVQAGIAKWLRDVTGLTQRHVVWDFWKVPRPAAPFIEMSIQEISAVGEDWVVYDDAPDPQPGAELRATAYGFRELKLVLQAFGQTDAGSVAWPLLTRVVGSIPLFQADLDDAGAGVGDAGPVTSVEGRKGGILEPRARCEITLSVMSRLESRTTYIQSFEARVRGPVPIDIDIVVPS
jgi:hypothetical protein